MSRVRGFLFATWRSNHARSSEQLMGWDTSDRRTRLPADWSTRRIRVLRRDNYRCKARDSRGIECGAPANQVDHIIPNDDDGLDNLQSLCRWHHSRKSSAEGVAARRPRARQSREEEQHPGIVQPDLVRAAEGPRDSPLPPSSLTGTA